MMRASLRQIDKDDVRIVARPVEHDLFPVGHDIERVYSAEIAEVGELTCGLRSQVEQPEVRCGTGWLEDQTRTIREEAIAATTNADGRQIDGGAVRSHPGERGLAGHECAPVHNQAASGRPDGIDRLTRDDANRI